MYQKYERYKRKTVMPIFIEILTGSIISVRTSSKSHKTAY